MALFRSSANFVKMTRTFLLLLCGLSLTLGAPVVPQNDSAVTEQPILVTRISFVTSVYKEQQSPSEDDEVSDSPDTTTEMNTDSTKSMRDSREQISLLNDSPSNENEEFGASHLSNNATSLDSPEMTTYLSTREDENENLPSLIEHTMAHSVENVSKQKLPSGDDQGSEKYDGFSSTKHRKTLKVSSFKSENPLPDDASKAINFTKETGDAGTNKIKEMLLEKQQGKREVSVYAVVSQNVSDLNANSDEYVEIAIYPETSEATNSSNVHATTIRTTHEAGSTVALTEKQLELQNVKTAIFDSLTSEKRISNDEPSEAESVIVPPIYEATSTEKSVDINTPNTNIQKNKSNLSNSYTQRNSREVFEMLKSWATKTETTSGTDNSTDAVTRSPRRLQRLQRKHIHIPLVCRLGKPQLSEVTHRENKIMAVTPPDIGNVEFSTASVSLGSVNNFPLQNVKPSTNKERGDILDTEESEPKESYNKEVIDKVFDQVKSVENTDVAGSKYFTKNENRRFFADTSIYEESGPMVTDDERIIGYPVGGSFGTRRIQPNDKTIQEYRKKIITESAPTSDGLEKAYNSEKTDRGEKVIPETQKTRFQIEPLRVGIVLNNQHTEHSPVSNQNNQRTQNIYRELAESRNSKSDKQITVPVFRVNAAIEIKRKPQDVRVVQNSEIPNTHSRNNKQDSNTEIDREFVIGYPLYTDLRKFPRFENSARRNEKHYKLPREENKEFDPPSSTDNSNRYLGFAESDIDKKTFDDPILDSEEQFEKKTIYPSKIEESNENRAKRQFMNEDVKQTTITNKPKAEDDNSNQDSVSDIATTTTKTINPSELFVAFSDEIFNNEKDKHVANSTQIDLKKESADIKSLISLSGKKENFNSGSEISVEASYDKGQNNATLTTFEFEATGNENSRNSEHGSKETGVSGNVNTEFSTLPNVFSSDSVTSVFIDGIFKNDDATDKTDSKLPQQTKTLTTFKTQENKAKSNNVDGFEGVLIHVENKTKPLENSSSETLNVKSDGEIKTIIVLDDDMISKTAQEVNKELSKANDNKKMEDKTLASTTSSSMFQENSEKFTTPTITVTKTIDIDNFKTSTIKTESKNLEENTTKEIIKSFLKDNDERRVNIDEQKPENRTVECAHKCQKELQEFICGTDGNVYNSICEMQCLNQNVEAGPWEKCRGKSVLCPLDCLDIQDPVCGDDGHIYRNLCKMRKRNCGRSIETRDFAFCTNRTRGQRACPESCHDDYRPVCGSNDKLYDNLCFLRKENCGKNVRMVRLSRCVQRARCPGYCLPLPDPVCGSDGRMYLNFCRLRLETCGKQVTRRPKSFCGTI